VVTGVWKDRDGDEDHACADLIERCCARRSAARALRRAGAQQRLRPSVQVGHRRHLPLADLEHAAAVDRFDFAMPMNRLRDGLLIRPVPVPSR